MTREEAIEIIQTEYEEGLLCICGGCFDFDRVDRCRKAIVSLSALQEKIDNAKETTWLTDGLTDEEIEQAFKEGMKQVQVFRTEEECEDCVSKAEVIKAIDKHTFDTEYGLCLDDDITCILKELPSVTPTHRKGKWIKKSTIGDWKDYLKCSCCGYSTYDKEKEDCTEFLNYCPNCGAEMKGERE